LPYLSLTRDLKAQAGMGFISSCTTASPVVVAAAGHQSQAIRLLSRAGAHKDGVRVSSVEEMGASKEPRRGSGMKIENRVKPPSLVALYFLFLYLPILFYLPILLLIYYLRPHYPKRNGNIQFTFSLILYQVNNAKISSLLCLNLILTIKCQYRKIIIRSKNNKSL